MKTGRPIITTNDLPENWEMDIINLSKIGGSIVEIAVLLDISRNTLTAMTERDPNFLNTIKKCKRLCEAWWMKQGRTELDNKDFSYTGWYMNMKNRFGWADKIEQTVNERKNVADLVPDDGGEDE
jgi:hypothetical protein